MLRGSPAAEPSTRIGPSGRQSAQRRRKGGQRRAMWCAVVLSAVFVLIVVFVDVSLALEHGWIWLVGMDEMKSGNEARMHIFHSPQEGEVQDPHTMPAALQGTGLDTQWQWQAAEGPRTQREVAAAFAACQSCSQLQWLGTPQCYAVWRRMIAEDAVSAVVSVEGFTKMRKSALRLELLHSFGAATEQLRSEGQNTSQEHEHQKHQKRHEQQNNEYRHYAYFKSCGRRGEYPENEVIAAHLDRLLHSNRAAPATMRCFDVAHLRSLVKGNPDDKRQLLVLDTMESTCGFNGKLCGALIGWWDDLQSHSTQHSRPLLKRDPITEDIRSIPLPLLWSYQERLVYHTFLYLSSNTQNAQKTDFSVPSGHRTPQRVLVYVDLDRSTVGSFHHAAPLSACESCIATPEVLRSITEPALHMGHALRWSLALLEPQMPIWLSKHASDTLERKRESLARCFVRCGRRPHHALALEPPAFLSAQPGRCTVHEDDLNGVS